MNNLIEEGTLAKIDFNKIDKIGSLNLSVVPVVVQNAETNSVIMIGYANKFALDETLKTGFATFWSTSRNELWRKGSTSGDQLKLVEVMVNCEQNSLLYKVIPQGKGCCHTKRKDGTPRSSCFYRTLSSDGTMTLDKSI